MQQAAIRLEWRPLARFLLGADLPVTIPNTAAEQAFGFSNPLVFAEAALPLPDRTRAALGSQFELPYGDISGGFASDHLMAVPYLTVGRAIGPVSLSVRLGWSTTVPYHAPGDGAASPYDNPLGGSAGSARIAHHPPLSAGSPSFIEPHSDRDFLFRIGVGWKSRVAATEVQLSGAHALESGFSPRHSLSAGLSFDFPFGDRVSVLPDLRFPLTRPSRFESAGGVGIRAAF